MYRDQELVIRPIENEDLPRLWALIFKDENPEWKLWDTPYYPHKTMAYEDFLNMNFKFVQNDAFWAIEVNEVVVGIVSYYWEHEPSNWLEIGIVFHEAPNWAKGLGTRALTLWINHLLNTLPIVRIGFSTWSGNKRMIRVGEKLGMQMEACIRKARYYNGEYYDSIRMGMLREEGCNEEKNFRKASAENAKDLTK
ncbi:GNAT family N-acetyltransferase [Viridibacillus sp. NPDC096237]|uniref:GNAT family N-acetyltransferase n=1 Tax=Viridibacillus sp. NPDC096237 TaxID=3390721 RepID=UPI003D046790